MQDSSRTSRQKTCTDGPEESEDCHYASAALQHNGNPLLVIVRFACLRNSGTCPLAKTSLSRRQPSIATLRREIDVIVRCAPNVIKLSLLHAAHSSGRLSPSSASAAVVSPPARPPTQLRRLRCVIFYSVGGIDQTTYNTINAQLLAKHIY